MTHGLTTFRGKIAEDTVGIFRTVGVQILSYGEEVIGLNFLRLESSLVPLSDYEK